MKKGVIFAILFFGGISIFAQTPAYITTRRPDGTVVYVCATENDALILLNNYNLPDHFWFIVPMKGISLMASRISGDYYFLDGSKLADEIAILSQWYFDLDPNKEYNVCLDVEFKSLIPNLSPKSYFSSIVVIQDTNGNEIQRK